MPERLHLLHMLPLGRLKAHLIQKLKLLQDRRDMQRRRLM